MSYQPLTLTFQGGRDFVVYDTRGTKVAVGTAHPSKTGDGRVTLIFEWLPGTDQKVNVLRIGRRPDEEARTT